MWAIVIIVLLVLLSYSSMVFLLALGVRKLQKVPFIRDGKQQPVTIVVPFRNEREHLAGLVRDLSLQTHPSDRMEVLFINDHSEDGSLPLLQELISGVPHFICLDLPYGREGKKEALKFGIAHAGNEWIIQLDADGRIGPGFVASHMSFQQITGADLVAGWVITGETASGWIGALERLDQLSMAGVAAGSFSMGRPLVCSGANLAYSRTLFRETRPFDPGPEIASGDDMFLMIGARKLGRRLAFLPDREAAVSTQPAGGILSMIRQRMRWSAKATRFRTADIQGVLLLILIAQLLILVMPWLIWFDPAYWGWMVAGFSLKTLADFLLIFGTARQTGQQHTLWMFLPVLLLYYPFYGIVMVFAVLFKNRWKGR
jgi:biofilm PGA synthesis N-glycosyltransferase PgaC